MARGQWTRTNIIPDDPHGRYCTTTTPRLARAIAPRPGSGRPQAIVDASGYRQQVEATSTLKPRVFAAAAGVPPEIGDEFVAGLVKTLPITSWVPLNRSQSYTASYTKVLYGRLAEKLKTREPPNRRSLLINANLLLLYLDKEDGSELAIFARFDTEALVAPMRFPDFGNTPLATGNQKRKAANDLIREGKRAIRHARKLLSIIAEEVSNRDNRTCLLLPPKNFGSGADAVFECVRDASLARDEREEFKKRLDDVSRSLRTQRKGSREYFVGQRGLVFRSPGKAGARHGLAPDLEITRWSRCLLRDPGTTEVRGVLRPGISLRLRHSRRWRPEFSELPRRQAHIP